MATRHDALFSNGLKNDFDAISIAGQYMLLCETEDGTFVVMSAPGAGQICFSSEHTTAAEAIADATAYLEARNA